DRIVDLGRHASRARVFSQHTAGAGPPRRPMTERDRALDAVCNGTVTSVYPLAHGAPRAVVRRWGARTGMRPASRRACPRIERSFPRYLEESIAMSTIAPETSTSTGPARRDLGRTIRAYVALTKPRVLEL